MSSNPKPYTLNGGETVYGMSTSEALAFLQGDTQERAQRVIETGAAAAAYVVYAGACAAMARKEIAARQTVRGGRIGFNVLQFKAR